MASSVVVAHAHVHNPGHRGRRRTSASIIEEPMPLKSAIVRESPEVRRQTVTVTGALWSKRRLALTRDRCCFSAVGSEHMVLTRTLILMTHACRCSLVDRCVCSNLTRRARQVEYIPLHEVVKIDMLSDTPGPVAFHSAAGTDQVMASFLVYNHSAIGLRTQPAR